MRRLLSCKTNREIKPNDSVLTFRGEEGIFLYISPSRRNHIVISLGGREREFFPSIIDAKIVEDEDEKND